MDADLEVRSSSLHAGIGMRELAGTLRPGTGAAAVPTPSLNNAPTFEKFVDQVTDVVTNQGSASPSSVGDGTTIGTQSRLSSEALKGLPVELWDERDLAQNGRLAEVACFEHNAINLNLRYEPYPSHVEDAIRDMIASGIIHSQWGAGADASALGGGGGGGSLGAEIDGEASGAEAPSLTALQSLLRQAQDTLEQAKRDALPSEGGKAASVLQAEALVTALELSIKQHAMGAAPWTPAAKPTGSGGQYTIAARKNPPPIKTTVATPKSLVDQTSMQQLQRVGAGALHRLRKQHPKTLKACCGDAAVASPELMPAALLTDTLFRLKEQNAVLETVMAAFEHAATESALATLASISGKAADTTFSRIIDAGGAKALLSPVDRLFGILHLGDLSMAVALQNWVPQPSEAAAKLAAAAQDMSFLDEFGRLNVSSPAKTLLHGMAEAGDGEDDNDYDALMRSVARAVAEARDAPFRVAEDDGSVMDWQEFVHRTVRTVAKQGRKQFTAKDFSSLTGTTFKFGRLQNSCDLELRAALGPQVRARDPSVLAVAQDRRCINPACSRTMRNRFAICAGCGASQGRQWRCLLCTGHTPWDVLDCSSIWCGGSRDRSREATAAEVDEVSRRIMANCAARSSARVGGRGGGGGGGGQRVRQASCDPVSSLGQPPENGAN